MLLSGLLSIALTCCAGRFERGHHVNWVADISRVPHSKAGLRDRHGTGAHIGSVEQDGYGVREKHSLAKKDIGPGDIFSLLRKDNRNISSKLSFLRVVIYQTAHRP